jgi:hypothetical protein
MIWWWTLLLACRDPSEGISFVAGCELDIQPTGTVDGALEQAEPGCAGLQLDVMEVEGDGSHRVDWFVGPDFVLPSITGTSPDATVSVLTVTGRWGLMGGAEERWRLPYDSTEWASRVDASTDPGLGFEGAGEDWWGAMLAGEEGAVLAGALSSASAQLSVRLAPDGVAQLRWEIGDTPLGDGGFLYLDPAFLGVGPEPVVLWDRWQQSVSAQRVGGRGGPPLPAAWRGAPDQVGEALAEEAFGTFVIDAPADADLSEVVDEVTAAGGRVGRTLRPLEVAADDPLVDEQPDWWLRELDGSLRERDGHVVLDALASGASAWLAERVAEQVADGVTYLRVEGLEAAARPALREAPLPDAEALAVTLDAIDDGADGALVVVDGPWLTALSDADGALGAPGDAEDRFLRARVDHGWGEVPLPDDPALAAALSLSGAGGSTGDVALPDEVVAARTAAVVSLAVDGPAVGWSLDNGWQVWLNPSDAPWRVSVPAGHEAVVGPADGALDAGGAVVWRPASGGARSVSP